MLKRFLAWFVTKDQDNLECIKCILWGMMISILYEENLRQAEPASDLQMALILLIMYVPLAIGIGLTRFLINFMGERLYGEEE